MFVIILRYLVDSKKIDEHRPEHLLFLDKYYEDGIFLISGRQNPASGGIIIAKAKDRNHVEEVIKQDPFYFLSLAEYQIFEFVPSKYADGLKGLL